MTEEERVTKALDTLAELCDREAYTTGEETADYNLRENSYSRRSAAEEILRHYRETEVLKNLVITLNVNGAIPVRPMTKTEMQS